MASSVAKATGRIPDHLRGCFGHTIVTKLVYTLAWSVIGKVTVATVTWLTVMEYLCHK
jgi:hypothetical protein